MLNKSRDPATFTLGDTVPFFIQLYAKPKNRGWKESERLLGKFRGLFGKPLSQIARSDIVRVSQIRLLSFKALIWK